MCGKVIKVAPVPFLRLLRGSCSLPHVEVTASSVLQRSPGLTCLLCKGHRGVMRVKTIQRDTPVILSQMSAIRRRFKKQLTGKEQRPKISHESTPRVEAFDRYLRVRKDPFHWWSQRSRWRKTPPHILSLLLDLPSGVPTTGSVVWEGSLLSWPVLEALTGMATAVLETTGGVQRGM